MTNLPPPAPTLLGLFTEGELRLLHEAFHGAEVWPGGILPHLTTLEESERLMQQWGVDWRDFAWRIRHLEDDADESLLTWLGAHAAQARDPGRPPIDELLRAMGARPTGSGLTLAYACGHDEASGPTQHTPPASVHAFAFPCPACALARHRPKEVQLFPGASPRDILVALWVRRAVLEVLRPPATPKPALQLPFDITRAYVSSLRDVEWWLERENLSPFEVAAAAVTPAIEAAATMEEVKVLLRHEFSAVREDALRRLAKLTAR